MVAPAECNLGSLMTVIETRAAMLTHWALGVQEGFGWPSVNSRAVPTHLPS